MIKRLETSMPIGKGKYCERIPRIERMKILWKNTKESGPLLDECTLLERLALPPAP
jgi:hypothetical protein